MGRQPLSVRCCSHSPVEKTQSVAPNRQPTESPQRAPAPVRNECSTFCFRSHCSDRSSQSSLMRFSRSLYFLDSSRVGSRRGAFHCGSVYLSGCWRSNFFGPTARLPKRTVDRLRGLKGSWRRRERWSRQCVTLVFKACGRAPPKSGTSL
jgi:hypothetical protein